MPPLLIVSRARPDLLVRFREAFEDFPGMEIITDRRIAPRPNPPQRRRWDVDTTLQAYGWAVVVDEGDPGDDPGDAPRILIADDHEDTRHLLEWVLRRAGYQVMHADDGGVALAKAWAWRPHLAVVDMFMPEKDGAEVIRALRGSPRPPKILAISAGWGAGGVRLAGVPDDFDVLED